MLFFSSAIFYSNYPKTQNRDVIEFTIHDFIVAKNSSSKSYNPLNFKLWYVLEELACSKPHLKMTKAAQLISIDVERPAIDKWPNCLKSCMKKKEEYFE